MFKQTSAAKLLTVLLCASAFAPSALHADNTWTGASGTSVNWNKNTNWSGNTVPSNGANLHFSGTTGLSNNNNISSFTANEIFFDSGAGAFTLSGNALSVGGTFQSGILNSSTNTQTLSFGGSGITLASEILVRSNSGQIVFNSKINLNGHTLISVGDQTTTYNGQISGSGTDFVASFVVGGDGYGVANVILNGNNTFTSGSSFGAALLDGTLTVNNNNALGTGTFLIAAGQSQGVTFGSGSNGLNIGNDIEVQSSFTINAASGTTSGTLTLSGKMTLDTSGTSNPEAFGNTTGTFHITTLNDNVVRFTGGIAQSGTGGPAGLVLQSGSGVNGQFFFGGSAANTYTGLTTVTGSTTLILNHSGTNNAIAGDLQIDSGGLVKLNNPEQIADTSKVTVNGIFNLSANNETIGSLFGSGTTQLGSGTLTVGSGSYSGDIRDNGNGGGITKTGTGTLILASASHYSGPTTLQGGTLLVDNNNSIGSGTLVINGTSGVFGSLSNGINVSNNVDVQTSFGIAPATTGTGGLQLSGTVTLDVTGTTAFTITAKNGNSVRFSNTIQQTGTVPVALTLDGGGVSGAFTFGGTSANTYTGTTTVTNGATLSLNKTAGTNAIAGDLQIDANSTVRLQAANQIADTSNVTTNGLFFLNDNNETINGLFGSGTARLGSGTLTLSSGSFDGDIRDSGSNGGLTKTGTGTLILTNASHYSGPTNLLSGTLLVNNANAIGTGTLVINGTSATLGSLAGNLKLDNAVDVLTNFKVAPSGTVASGTLTMNGLITLDTGTTSGTTNFTITQTNSNVFRFIGGIAQSGSGVAALTFDGGGVGVQGSFRSGSSTAASTYGGLTTVTDYATLILNNAGTNVAVPGNLQIDANSTVRYVGNSEQIADTATVTDNGTWNLNNRTETIATLLGSGTIQTGSGTLNLTSGTFAGQIVGGDAAINKTGPGTLKLGGFNLISGSLNINGGQVVMDGTIGMKIFVNTGTLSGTGFVADTITNASHLAVGDAGAPGVFGNKGYIQTAAGTLTMRVGGTGPGQSDFMYNEGGAALDGTLELVRLNNYQGKLGDKIQLLSGNMVGTFSTVINPFDTNTMVKADIIYDPASGVYLSFDQGSFFQYAQKQGLTPNQSSVARNLDAAAGSPFAASLITFLNGEPLSNLPHDFDLISPEELTAIFDISRSYADVQGANIEQRLTEDRAETQPQGVAVGLMVGDGKSSVDKNVVSSNSNRKGGWDFFMEGSGEFVHANGDANAAGYDFTTAGVTIGADYRFCDHFVAGIMGGYANTGSTLVNNGDVDVNGGKLGLFGTYYTGGFYVNGLAAGGYNSYDTHRTALLGIAQGSTEGWEFDGLLGTGYDLVRGENGVTFGPVANVQYTHVGIDGFNETGSLAPLGFPSQSEQSFRSKVGFHLTYAAKFGGITVTPGVTAGWQHEFLDSSYALDSQFANGAGGIFRVNGPKLGRDSVVVNAGFSVQWTDRIGSYLYYDGELGRKNYQLNSVTGGVRVNF